jgi:hypothetical protein
MKEMKTSSGADKFGYVMIGTRGHPSETDQNRDRLKQLAAFGPIFRDPKNAFVGDGCARRGGEGSRSPQRLALIANQLSPTRDIHDTPVERLTKILPEELGATVAMITLR